MPIVWCINVNLDVCCFVFFVTNIKDIKSLWKNIFTYKLTNLFHMMTVIKLANCSRSLTKNGYSSTLDIFKKFKMQVNRKNIQRENWFKHIVIQIHIHYICMQASKEFLYTVLHSEGFTTIMNSDRFLHGTHIRYHFFSWLIF